MAQRIALGELYIDDIAIEEAAGSVIDAAKARRGGYVVTPNAAMAHAAFHNDAFAALLRGAFLSLADGVGITQGARLLKTPLKNGRLVGIELGEVVAEQASEAGLSLYFLGGREGVAARAAKEWRLRFPHLIVAGTRNGYFSAREEAEVIQAIRQSGADLLYCCLGSPRQERVAAAMAAPLAMPILCLGGSLDVWAKEAHRAPRPIQKIGCEWLWRTLCEPVRLRRLPALFGYVGDVCRLKWKKTLAMSGIKRYNKKK